MDVCARFLLILKHTEKDRYIRDLNMTPQRVVMWNIEYPAVSCAFTFLPRPFKQINSLFLP